ncbi:MAG: hypothetical protein ABFR36_07090 [Acidobacteriota bacterium]
MLDWQIKGEESLTGILTANFASPISSVASEKVYSGIMEKENVI